MALEEQSLSGLRHPDPPVEGLDKVGVTTHYLDHFEREFVRTRRQAKDRARLAVVFRAVLGGAATVVAATAAGLSSEIVPMVLGIVVTSISAASAAIAVWDGHFRHEQLWVQRTLIIGELTRVRIRFEADRLSLGEDAADIALAELDRVLRLDISTWVALRGVDSKGANDDVRTGLSAV
jgi:hypothetical protein